MCGVLNSEAHFQHRGELDHGMRSNSLLLEQIDCVCARTRVICVCAISRLSDENVITGLKAMIKS